jgi:hypothetical protein
LLEKVLFILKGKNISLILRGIISFGDFPASEYYVPHIIHEGGTERVFRNVGT